MRGRGLTPCLQHGYCSLTITHWCARAWKNLLRSRGVEVVAAVGTGEEGVNRALALHPDIVLLDIRMPIMNGIETLTRLRECGVTRAGADAHDEP